MAAFLLQLINCKDQKLIVFTSSAVTKTGEDSEVNNHTVAGTGAALVLMCKVWFSPNGAVSKTIIHTD